MRILDRIVGVQSTEQSGSLCMGMAELLREMGLVERFPLFFPLNNVTLRRNLQSYQRLNYYKKEIKKQEIKAGVIYV